MMVNLVLICNLRCGTFDFTVNEIVYIYSWIEAIINHATHFATCGAMWSFFIMIWITGIHLIFWDTYLLCSLSWQVKIGLRVLTRPMPERLPHIYRTLGENFNERVLPSIIHETLKAVVAQYNASQLITQREVWLNISFVYYLYFILFRKKLL